MLAIVYFCNGKIKGYVHHNVELQADPDSEQGKTFLENMVFEGLKAEDNIVIQSHSFGSVVFDVAGKPIFTFHHKAA